MIISSLNLGGIGAACSLLLGTIAPPDSLPLAEGVGASSLIILLWAVKILKNERDMALKKLANEQVRLISAELKCLNCEYFRYNRLMHSILTPNSSETPL